MFDNSFMLQIHGGNWYSRGNIWGMQAVHAKALEGLCEHTATNIILKRFKSK